MISRDVICRLRHQRVHSLSFTHTIAITCVVLATIALPSFGSAQALVQGFVRSRDGEALGNASVQLRGISDTTVFRSGSTDRLGYFRFSRVNAGDHELIVERIGSVRSVQRITVTDTTQTLTIELDEEAVSLNAVTVEATRARARFQTEAGVTSRELAQDELKLIPGFAESDLLRAVEVLPGVISTSDFTSAFNVRGGSADQNLILIDGIPIYNPFHLGGLFSVFSSDMVERAELLAGGFPARYGGRVSSVLNVDSDPGERGTDVRGGISMLAARLAVGTDVPQDWTNAIGLRSAHVRASVRRSYFDQLFKPLFDFPYHLTDTQLYAEGWTPDGARVSVTGYAGRDLLDFTGVDDFPLRIRWDWGNQVLGTRYERGLNDGGRIDARAGFTRFATSLGFPQFDDTEFASSIRQFMAATDVALPFRGNDVRFGGEVSRIDYKNDARTGGTVFLDAGEGGWMSSAFAQLDIRPSAKWLVEAGVRMDAWTASETSVEIAPRLAAKRFITRDAAVKLAVGRYVQFMHSVRDEELPVGIDLWVLSGNGVPYVVSDQIQGGFELLRDDWQFTLDGYVRDFKGVITVNPAEDPNDETDDLVGGDGLSYGADLLLRKERGNTRGFISVSYLKADRTFPDTRSGRSPAPDVSYAPIFDRRLDIDLVLRTTLPKRWVAGLRWNIGTGLPYTKPIGSYTYYQYQIINNARLLNDTPDSAGVAVIIGDRNRERYPTYNRLDLSFRKEIQRGWARLTPYVEILNVLNRRNVLFYFFDYQQQPAVRSGISMFPLLPTAGVEIVF